MDAMKHGLADARSKWFPAGMGIYYDCLACGVRLPSITAKQASCQCGNLAIESGRVYLGEARWFRTYTVR